MPMVNAAKRPQSCYTLIISLELKSGTRSEGKLRDGVYAREEECVLQVMIISCLWWYVLTGTGGPRDS